MAPERFEGGQIDPRADIYALTCVLYECLTGARPYQADSLEQQIAGHMVSPPPRPSAIDPKLAAFDDVIAKGMAKKPGKRYQTAAELAAAARRALNAPVRRRAGSGRHSAGGSDRSGRGCPGGRWRWRARVVLVAAWARSGCGSGGAARDAAMPDRRASPRVRRRRAGRLPAARSPAIAATVPADIRATGRLVIGVNVPYAPNEFKDSSARSSASTST